MKNSLLLFLTVFIAFMSHGQDSISVLFIGNSYTQVNDLPSVTSQLALSMGKKITAGTKANGGYSFSSHYGDPQTFAAMHQKNWDVVVLQDQSQMPAFPDDQVNTQTIPFAIRLADSVYEINPCSNVLYYMTWGRENGDPQWEPISTFNGMNQRLYNAYMRMADSTDGMVSPVGAVWKYVRDNHPDIHLYNGDGSHPSMEGTYLAACTFYVSLFREPVSSAGFLSGLNPQVAQQIRTAADNVLLDSLEHFKIHAVDEPVQAKFDYVINNNEVTFSNTSTRDESWNWVFGDGNSSTSESPVHTYSVAGNYEVSLTATNACKSHSITKTLSIATVSVPELEALRMKEYNDRFVIENYDEIEGYEITGFDGKTVVSSNMEKNEISKVLNSGILILKFKSGHYENIKFIKW